MTRRLLLLLTVTCAVGVGTIYFPQAITPLIASGLDTSESSAALAVTFTQIGYSIGIFLIVPLGDRIPNRRLLTTLLGLTGLELLAAGCAPTLPVLLAASVAVGTTTVAAQVVSPMAAGLVPVDRRGAVMGTLLSGATGGMLLARTFSGTLGEYLGWRAPYLAAGVLTLALAAVLTRTLPDVTAVAPAVRPSYGSLLVEPLRLLRDEPELRRSGFYQAMVFGGFCAVWTCLPLLLTGPEYGFGAQTVGLIALVGAATMVCTPIAGRVVDRRGADPVNLAGLLGALASAAVLAAGGGGGAAGLAVLVAGTLLLDVSMQSGMIANKTRVYELRADARSRLNTAYMTFGYLGGSVGSWLGLCAHALAGWAGVCTLLALLCTLALTRHLFEARRRRTVPPTVRDHLPERPRDGGPKRLEQHDGQRSGRKREPAP
ncbi:MFS transporter [Kitasatospora purpeofusca]|uniref:MFS transporter n=1 Tax=Kitasatospora purpeofusca TaxID=67352 RepID=UPI003699B96B